MARGKEKQIRSSRGSLRNALAARGAKLSSRAAQAGFDWPDVEGLFDKLHEETEELREQFKEFPAPGPRPQGRGVAGRAALVVPEPLQLAWRKKSAICSSSW